MRPTMDARVLEAAARAAHEACRAYRLALSDTSQPTWDDAPDWLRTSTMYIVQHIVAGGYPRQAHESWCKEKRATGWIWGRIQDPERKEHPYLVPYEDLPPEYRSRDTLYTMIVRAMCDALYPRFPNDGPPSSRDSD